MPTEPDRPQAYFDAMDRALRERESGTFDPEAFKREHPDHALDVLEEIAILERLESPGPMAFGASPAFHFPARERPPGGTTVDARAGKPGRILARGPLESAAVPSRLGDFELRDEIGRGGMGVVYAARQIGLDRDVAVKLLPPGFAADVQLRRRFEREAELAARLTHPGIVRIYAFGENDGILYLAMERIDGASLQAVLAELGERTAEALAAAVGAKAPAIGGFRGYVDTLVEIGAVIADALEDAHRGGLVHRDVKPGNILLDRRLEPHLADFGLARSMDSHSITASGQVLGTPGFLAPECIRGEAAGAQSDVFALGVTLYEALSRQRPFDGKTTAEILNRVLNHDPPALDRLDKRIAPDLANVIQRAVEKEPNRRYPSAAALRDDLRRFQRGDPVSAVRIGAVGIAVRRARRRPRTTVLAAVLILAVVGLGAASIVSGIQRSNETKRRHAELVERARELESQQPMAALAIYREAASLEDDGGPGTDAVARLTPIFERERRRGFHELLLTEILTSPAALPPVRRAKLDQWVAESGADRDGAFARAVIAFNRDDPAGALVELEKASAIERTQGVDYLRAYALTELGRPEEARAARRRAEAAAPRYIEDYAIAAGYRDRQGDPEAAIDLLRRGEARFPDSPFLNTVHGWLCFLSWRLAEAMSKYQQALLREPDFIVARQGRGRCLLELGRHQEAIAEFERVLEQRPDFTEAKIGLAEAIFRDPSRDRKARLARALEIVDEAFEQERTAALYNFRGWIRAHAGRYAEAEADYRKALELEPAHGLAIVNLCVFLRLARRLDEHERHIDACVARKDLPAVTKIALLNDRAIRYWTADPEKARVALARALDFRRTPNILANLALLNLNQGRFEEAAAQLTEQIGKGYNVAIALCRRGYVRYRLLDVKRAAIDQDLGLARAAEVSERSVLPWMVANRARLDAARGRFEEAWRRIGDDRVLTQTGMAAEYVFWRFRAAGEKGLRDALEELSPRARNRIDDRASKILDAWLAGLDGRFEDARAALPEPRKGHDWPGPDIRIAIEWGARGEGPLRDVAARLLRGESAAGALAALPAFERTEDDAKRDWLTARAKLEAAGGARLRDAALVEALEVATNALPFAACALDLAIARSRAGDETKALDALRTASERGMPDQSICDRLIQAKIEPTPALRTWLSRGRN